MILKDFQHSRLEKRAIYDHFTPAVTIQSPIIVYSFTVVYKKKSIEGTQAPAITAIEIYLGIKGWRRHDEMTPQNIDIKSNLGVKSVTPFFNQRMLVSNALVFWVCFENSFIWCIICCCFCWALICLRGGLLLKLTCNNLDVKYGFLCDVSIVSGLFMTWRVFGFGGAFEGCAGARWWHFRLPSVFFFRALNVYC